MALDYDSSASREAPRNNNKAGTSISDAALPLKSEMIIRTASVSLEMKNNDKAYEELRIKLNELQGLIADSNSYKNGDAMIHQLTVRVPADSYDEFLEYLKSTGKVTSLKESGYDVSDEYNDNALRIQMLENKLERLYDLMAKADEMTDLITIENAVSETIYQIENLKGTNRVLEDKVSYATFTVTLRQEAEVVHTGIFEGLFSDAFSDSMNSFMWFIRGLVRFVFYVAPYGLIALILWPLARKIFRKKNTKDVG